MIKFIKLILKPSWGMTKKEYDEWCKNDAYMNRVILEGSDFDKADRIFHLLCRKINLYKKKGNISRLIVPIWMSYYNSNRVKMEPNEYFIFCGVNCIAGYNKLPKIEYGDNVLIK